VKLFDSDLPGERFILCRSDARRSKERAMREKFGQRAETALERPKSRIVHAKKPLDKSQVDRHLSSSATQLSRGDRFDISLPDSDNPAGFALRVRIHDEFDRWAELSEGS